MIVGADRATLPAGVFLEGAGLRDSVRGVVFALNPAGRFVVAHADRRPLAEIAERLAARFGLAPDQAVRDVRTFASELNARLLLNLDPPWGGLSVAARWLALAPRLLPLGALPSLPRRRRPIASESARAAALAVARGLAPLGLAAATLAGGASAFVLAGLGAPQVELPLLLGAWLGFGLIVHEAGHAACLRGVPCCLGTAGLRAFVLHRPLPARRRAWVAAAGPAAALALAAAALGAALLLELEELALGSLVPSAQSMGLTVAGRDGRAACGLS